ncbi:hypothetical protein, partial [Streptomyces sp. NPDC058985]|uniref:hypothetical protein n=1 Tax=Streptomyces sp. NPDC058985 TaxID=3346684 RepID=UPI00368EFC38
LAFPTLSDLSDPISSVLSRFPLSRFPFRRFRLYQKFRVGLTGSFVSDLIGGGCFVEFEIREEASRCSL